VIVEGFRVPPGLKAVLRTAGICVSASESALDFSHVIEIFREFVRSVKRKGALERSELGPITESRGCGLTWRELGGVLLLRRKQLFKDHLAGYSPWG